MCGCRPINSWDRLPFLTHVKYGADHPPSFEAKPNEIVRNFISADYGGSQAFDNDDGSSWCVQVVVTPSLSHATPRTSIDSVDSGGVPSCKCAVRSAESWNATSEVHLMNPAVYCDPRSQRVRYSDGVACDNDCGVCDSDSVLCERPEMFRSSGGCLWNGLGSLTGCMHGCWYTLACFRYHTHNNFWYSSDGVKMDYVGGAQLHPWSAWSRLILVSRALCLRAVVLVVHKRLYRMCSCGWSLLFPSRLSSCCGVSKQNACGKLT
jgi:hypothetical protein